MKQFENDPRKIPTVFTPTSPYRGSGRWPKMSGGNFSRLRNFESRSFYQETESLSDPLAKVPWTPFISLLQFRLSPGSVWSDQGGLNKAGTMGMH